MFSSVLLAETLNLIKLQLWVKSLSGKERYIHKQNTTALRVCSIKFLQQELIRQYCKLVCFSLLATATLV
jgi:hypothetical protein